MMALELSCARVEIVAGGAGGSPPEAVPDHDRLPLGLGTAFLISPSVALTASHCVDGRDLVALRFMRTDPAGEGQRLVREAHLLASEDDCSVLRLTEPVDDEPGLERGVGMPSPRSRWQSRGWPAGVDVPVEVHGRVRGPAILERMSWRIRLTCEEVAHGLVAPGLSGSPLVVDGRVHGLLSNALMKGDASMGGALYSLRPGHLDQAILRAAADKKRWPVRTFVLNNLGGRAELDPLELRVRALENEDDDRFPLAALRGAWPGGVRGTTLRIIATSGRSKVVECSDAGKIHELLRALPAYATKRKLVITRPQLCAFHRDDAERARADSTSDSSSAPEPARPDPAVVEFGLARDEVHRSASGEVIPDLAVQVTAPRACIAPLEAAVVRSRTRLLKWLRHVAAGSLLGFMAMAVYMMYFEITFGIAAVFLAALIPPAAQLGWRTVADHRVKARMLHFFDGEAHRFEDRQMKELRMIKLDGGSPFSCRIGVGRQWVWTAGVIAVLTVVLAVDVVKGLLIARMAGIEAGRAIGVVSLKTMLYGAAPALAGFLAIREVSRRLLKKDKGREVGVVALTYLLIVALFVSYSPVRQLPFAGVCFELERNVAFTADAEFALRLRSSQSGIHEVKVERMRAEDGVWSQLHVVKSGEQLITIPMKDRSSGDARRLCIAVDEKHGLSRADLVVDEMWLRQQGDPTASRDLVPLVQRPFVIPEGAGQVTRQSDGTYHVCVATSDEDRARLCQSGEHQHGLRTSTRDTKDATTVVDTKHAGDTGHTEGTTRRVQIKLEEPSGDRENPRYIGPSNDLMSYGPDNLVEYTLTSSDIAKIDRIGRLCIAVRDGGPPLELEVTEATVTDERASGGRRSLLHGRVTAHGRAPTCEARSRPLTMQTEWRSHESGWNSWDMCCLDYDPAIRVSAGQKLVAHVSLTRRDLVPTPAPVKSEDPAPAPAAAKGAMTIEITDPPNAATVEMRAEVAGRVSNPMAGVWVIVKPKLASDCWIQAPAAVGGDGAWTAQVQFGEADTHGEGFDIMAIANPKDRELREGRARCWPAAEAKSKVVRVARP